MTTQSSTLGDLLQLAAKEGKRRLLTLATMFSLAALLALAVVLGSSRTWEATAVIVAEGNNIIKPLMEGRAVPTTISDQTANVTQKVQSRRILKELAQYAGIMRGAKYSPQEEERMLAQFRGRIRIDAARELIRVSYRDSDPRRTYMVANKVAEVFVREGVATKERESREAFDFISKQAKEYGEKLGQAQDQLLAYYRGQTSFRPASVTPTPLSEDGTPAPAPTRLKITPEQLAALRLEQATLEAQVERKPAGGAAVGPARDEGRQLEEGARTRVQQAQVELDRLLGTYTDQHPDVKRVQRNLAGAKEDLLRAEQARTDRDSVRAAATAMDDEVTRAGRARLEEVRRQISAATGQPIRRRTSSGPRTAVAIAAAAAAAEAATVPEMRGVGQDTKLSELSRRYEATRDVYQDLLKRRENARVSMELDIEQRGFTLRIQELAEMPTTASGPRLLHRTAIGLVLALLVPVAFLFAVVRFDPRVRSVGQIERLAKVPLLVAIPYAAPGGEARERNRRFLAIGMVVVVLIIYGVVFVLRQQAKS